MQYTKEVIQHFKSPHNQGTIKDASAIAEEGNPVCGDVMKIYLKIDKKPTKSNSQNKEEYIKDIKFETLGCAAAIAVSSALTDIAKGMTLSEALKLSKDDVIKSLGGLPTTKIHCSMLGVDALHSAVVKYLEKSNL